VAVLGATAEVDRVGYNILASLLYGGFAGDIYPVHPRLGELQGLRVYPSLAAVPVPPDLAVIALNERATVAALKECGRLGVRAAVCLAGGYKETGPAGARLEAELVETAAQYGIALAGPNTLGLINTGANLYVTFYPLRLASGSVSLVSQSGGMGLTMLYKAMDEGLGIEKFVVVGNRSVLDVADYLAYLGDDPGTRAVGLFLEGVEDARRLVELAGRVNRVKPVVVYKAGEAAAAAYAALTHTGSMVGHHRLYLEACRQYGLYTVDSADRAVTALKALTTAPPAQGRRVAVVTHTAGPGIVLVDRLGAGGAVFPPLSPETEAAVKKVMGDTPPVVIKNPLDAAGLGLSPDVIGRLTAVLRADPAFDLVLVVFCQHPHWPFPSPQLASLSGSKPVVACYIATQAGVRAEQGVLAAAGVPVYNSLEAAAGAADALMWYGGRGN
jgi:acetyltransferase